MFPSDPNGHSFEPTPGTANTTPPPPPQQFVDLQTSPIGSVTLHWTVTPGRTYRIEAKNDLGNGLWEKVGTIIASGTEASFTNTAATGKSARFNRVLLLP